VAHGFVVGVRRRSRGRSLATIEEDTMNPNFNWAIVAERTQTLQAEADAARARHAARMQRGTARARLARRSRRGLAFAPASAAR
jgi:hypothetical protein